MPEGRPSLLEVARACAELFAAYRRDAFSIRSARRREVCASGRRQSGDRLRVSLHPSDLEVNARAGAPRFRASFKSRERAM
jgi:hypothetical protein